MPKYALIAIFILASTVVNARQSGVSTSPRQSETDSIIAAVEKHFGWNDEAYSADIARDKIEKGDACLLLQGSIAPVVYIGQDKFKKKYGVDYYDFGCMAYCSEYQMKVYNIAIMDWLYSRYGDKWLKDIREDVPGLNEWQKPDYIYTAVEEMPVYGNKPLDFPIAVCDSAITHLHSCANYGPTRIVLEFVVERDGSLSGIEVKNITGELKELFEKAIARFRWTPGTHYGRPVRVRMRIPIHIHFQE